MTQTKEQVTSLESLKTQGSELIAWWHSVEESKTEILRKLAELVVEVRARFQDEETGEPDWRGKTWDYRQFMTEMYERAGVPPASVAGVQSSLRYHVGNRLREVLSAEQLAKAGLLSEGPRERVERQRSEAEAIWRALNDDAISHKLQDRRKAYRMLVSSAETLVTRLSSMPVEDLSRRDAAGYVETLAAVAQALEAVKAAIEDRLGAVTK